MGVLGYIAPLAHVTDVSKGTSGPAAAADRNLPHLEPTPGKLEG